MGSRSSTVPCQLLLLLLVPALAVAYGTRIHDLLPPRALSALRTPGGRSVGSDTVPGVTDADLASFRTWLWARAADVPDPAVGNAFRARYPSVAAFDARAMKEFLMMNGAARVLGVDSFAAVYRTMRPRDRRHDPHPDYIAGARMPLLLALQLGSIYADLDRRNQDRLLRDPSLAPERTRNGDSIPFDPITLNMGRLTGLSSQAHAHYGLNRHPKSDHPSTLKYAPWDFAIATGFAGPVETYATDNAQLYTDLALLASLDGRPSGRALGAIYAGNAAHYIADVGNAIHTVQVGIYPIFLDATVQHWLRSAKHLFGLLGRTPSRDAIGIDIITNLHTLSERLFEVEVTAGARVEPVADDSLAVVLADTIIRLRSSSGTPDFGRAIAAMLVDAGNRDGADVYRITRDMVQPDLRLGKVAMDFDTVPDPQVWRWLRADPLAHNRLVEFNALETRGLARTTSALRSWWTEYVRELSYNPASRETIVDRVVTRLVAERLAYLRAAESRRRTWILAHGGMATQ